MKRSRLYLFGFLGALLLMLVGLYIVNEQKIEAYAATAIYEGESYVVSFSSALKPESITNGTVLVLDEVGDKVEAKFVLNENRKELTITRLPAGTYTIQLKKDAFATKTKFKRDRTFEVEVLKEVTAFASEADVKAYFEMALARQSSHDRFTETLEESATVETTSNVASDSSASSSDRASGTNNQVEGIEEGDVVITDGRAIYTIIDNEIVITDAKNPQKMTVVKRIKLADQHAYPTHLVKHNNLLIVAYSSYVESQNDRYYDGKSIAKVAFYDMTDMAKPKLVREIGQDGNLIGLRKMQDTLYIVSTQSPNYWLLRENIDVELRPVTYDDEASTVLPIDRIHPLPGSNEPSYLIVSAVNVDKIADANVTTESYLGNSGQMYMSEQAIYMTAMNYSSRMMPEMERSMVDTSVSMMNANETTIYKVAIDKTTIEMAAKGVVKGEVLNQFSMDEYDGHFRIATTEGSSRGSTAESTNTLYILDEQLKEVGKVDNLARGERIYSARFMGDKAYIVTFKETDPLFVIDVANPKAPKVLGELKIPGFSNYLHPIGAHHLLGIGYDTSVTMQPGSKEPMVLTQGMKLSLFNVEDLANPVEQDMVIIGGRGTYSDVQYNHKALFRDSENSYYGFPITIYEPKGEYDVTYKGTGAQIYKVTTDGIELAADLVKPAAASEQYEDWNALVQRLLYMDESLYTVSRKEIKSYELDSFEPISSVKLQ